VIRWWLVIGLLLSVGLNVGILAAVVARRAAAPGRPAAQAPGQGQGQGQANPANANDPVPRLTRLADRLKLEGDTRRKFIDIQWNLYQETTRLRLDLGEIHRSLRKEMTLPNPDRPRVDALLADSSRTYLALEKSLVDNVFATRALLGPEKEAEYLKIVGRLRLPNPGPGISNPTAGPNGQAPQAEKPGLFERWRQRRQQRQERQQRRGLGGG
jgi:Heavy-metal resistance